MKILLLVNIDKIRRRDYIELTIFWDINRYYLILSILLYINQILGIKLFNIYLLGFQHIFTVKYITAPSFMSSQL